jgi:cytochrome c
MRGAHEAIVARVGVEAIILLLLPLAGCASPPAVVPTPRADAASVSSTMLTPAPTVPGNPENGRSLVMARGCGGCHTVPGIQGASGVIGPPLNNVALRPTLAGDSIPNSPDTMTRWIMDPPSLKPGTAMPRLGLTQQEAQDVTAFLYSQPDNPLP